MEEVERRLLSCARLHVLPMRAEHVLARLDQPLRVPDRVLVHRVGAGTRAFSPTRASATCDAEPLVDLECSCAWQADLSGTPVVRHRKLKRPDMRSEKTPGSDGA
jgi:hypothetical protein